MQTANQPQYIAFFDSGLGGLNTLKEALTQMPGASFIYYGDTANVPYGPKKDEEVRDLMVSALEFLSPYGLKALVIACNTGTCAAGAYLRDAYELPIIGMEPAIKPAVEDVGDSGGRVLLLATALTIKSAKLARLKALVDPNGIVDDLPCPELVELAESLNFDQDAAAGLLKMKLVDRDPCKYGAVVLGSTHYGYFRPAVEKLFPTRTKIIDGNAGTVRHLMNLVSYDDIVQSPSSGRILLHLTDATDQKKIALSKSLLEETSGLSVEIV